MSDNSAGITTFSGASKVLNTGAGAAVALSANGNPAGGHLVSFTNGGLDIDTTSGAGLSASGGTLTVVGTGNSITTGTGTGLNVVTAGIAASGLTFDSISSNGAVNGIRLNSTGTAGGLNVTGTGTAASGGTIQNSTGAGVELTSASGVSLTRMAITNGGDDGIRATTVNDVDLIDSAVSNNGNNHAGGAEERGLDYLDVTGTPQILRTTVSGSDDSNAHIRNTVAGTTALSVDQSTFSDSKFNAGLRLRGEGASVMNATVTGSVFSLNADPGFSMQTDSANTAQQTLLFDNNDVSGGSTNAVSAGRRSRSTRRGIDRQGDGDEQRHQERGGLGGHPQHAGEPHGHLRREGQRQRHRRRQPGTLDALADGGSSIWGWAHGDGVNRMEIRNNTVANWGGRAWSCR